MLNITSVSPAWLMVGGMGIFLFGIRLFSESLHKSVGPRFKKYLEYALSNRFSSFIAGALLTTLFHSETMSAILIVSFLNSGLLSIYQSLALFIGSIAGTIAAVNIFAIKSVELTFVYIFSGVVAKYLLKNRKLALAGDLVFSVGILFLGLLFIETGFSAILYESLIPRGILLILNYTPIAVATGLLLVIILQSSQAAAALTAGMLSTGVISIESAFMIMSGSLLGGPVMAVISSIIGSAGSRLSSVVFFLMNSFVVICSAFVVHYLPFYQSAATISQITILNYYQAIICFAVIVLYLPLLSVISRKVTALSASGTGFDADVKFLDYRILTTPGLAIHQIHNEQKRMAEITFEVLDIFYSLLYKYDVKKVNLLKNKIGTLDILQKEITLFTTRLAPNIVDNSIRNTMPDIYSTVHDLMQIAVDIEKCFEVIQIKKQQRINFSNSAMNDIKIITGEIHQNFERLKTEWDIVAIDSVAKLNQSILRLISQAVNSHLHRLAEGRCTVAAGVIFSDIMEQLRKINSLIISLVETRKMTGYYDEN